MTFPTISSSFPGFVTLFVSHALLFFTSQGILAQSLPKTFILNDTNTEFSDSPAGNDAETVGIKYSTGGKRASVTIRIFDFGMNLVRTVIQNAERDSAGGGSSIDFWDGRDERGEIVPNGVYFHRIDFDNGSPIYGKIMVVM